jgi:cobalt-zinc-cadmium efflux system outer membrane protein
MKVPLLFALAAALGGRCCGQSPVPLSQLLAEGLQENPDLKAGEHTWRAATHTRDQVMALPDPQFTVQEFSVGSPRPFAGFNTSNFAYIGIGASQELPYPGKRNLKGQAADAAANVEYAQISVLRASLKEQMTIAYLRLAYLQQTLALLESSRTTLSQVIESEMTRYSSGQGSQTDALKAQLERTKLVREITMHHEEMSQLEADLKQLLHRPQESGDIVAEDLAPTSLHHAAAELLDLVRKQNPEIRMEGSSVTKQDVQWRSAKRQSKPDFNIGYMYERTGTDFPAYYMLTFGMVLPRRSRVRAEVAEAAEMLAAATEHLDAALQQQLADTQKQYGAASTTAELLKQYSDGLVPQADAVFHAGITGYESNKQSLTYVLTALNDVLELKRGYERTLLDHELAVAHLEALTGATLR